MASTFDPYASLLPAGKSKTEAENAPVKKGEFAELLAKLSVDSRARVQKAIALLRELVKELEVLKKMDTGEDKEGVRLYAEAEVENSAKMILVALRRDDIKDDSLADTIRKQVYDTCLKTGNYEKAVSLYPKLKTILVQERMRGIYVLARADKLGNYFSKTQNAREGLQEIFTHPSTTGTSPDVNLKDPLYHFGTLLPLYYLFSKCSEIKEGLCGNCDSKSEDYIRQIIGPGLTAIKPDLIGRLCHFASVFA